MICSTLNPSFPLYLDMYVIYSYGTGVYCLPGRSGAPVEPEGDPGHHHNQAGGDVHLHKEHNQLAYRRTGSLIVTDFTLSVNGSTRTSNSLGLVLYSFFSLFIFWHFILTRGFL